jgi:hypothetical protein
VRRLVGAVCTSQGGGGSGGSVGSVGVALTQPLLGCSRRLGRFQASCHQSLMPSLQLQHMGGVVLQLTTQGRDAGLGQCDLTLSYQHLQDTHVCVWGGG